jgi:C1A family cysteine protease
MKKLIAIFIATIITLFVATSALVSAETRICTATDNHHYVDGAEETKVPKKAPLNPDFMVYRKDSPKASYGYIPPPVDLCHLDQLPVKGLPTPRALPSSFDWRDSGNVTSVKNQNPCGTCWIFGTTTVLESAVLINESAEYDFSEQSVAMCADRSWVYMYDDSSDPCMAGGWSWLASDVFIKKGSVLESCNPYNPAALNCDGSCVCDDCQSIKEVDGYRLATNDGSQIDVIKNAVYNQGPVTVAYWHDSSYLYGNPVYGWIHDKYPCSGYPNHLVSIIGWDDDVPHPNQYNTGTGAWIVKNSWGTGWGNNGFFYLAYGSSCMEEVAYFVYKDPVPDEELLYWDEAGHVASLGYGGNSAWMASVFTANQSGDLTHVDFWTTSSNAQYELYVWDGYFGTELASQAGNCQEYGYYSIPLNTQISMDAGQQFTVGVKMTTPGYGYPISAEAEISGTVEPPIQTNVSFIRHPSSSSWTDLADSDWNGCLRARMVREEEQQPDLKITDTWLCWPDNCTICYNVTNAGNGTASAGHNTTLFVDGAEKVYDSVSVILAPNTSYIGCFNYTWEYTPPEDNITVCADFNDTVTESNETNNCLNETRKCGDVDMDGTVDFLGDAISVARHYMYGDPIRCEWAGDIDCSGDIDFLGDAIKIARHYMYGEALDCGCLE